MNSFDLILSIMATEDSLQRKPSCSSYPDFAATCLFIEHFGEKLGLLPLNIKNLSTGFEDDSGGKLS